MEVATVCKWKDLSSRRRFADVYHDHNLSVLLLGVKSCCVDVSQAVMDRQSAAVISQQQALMIKCMVLPCRKSFPPATFKTKFSNITDIVRVWDFYSPDYNCPLLKERVGKSSIFLSCDSVEHDAIPVAVTEGLCPKLC